MKKRHLWLLVLMVAVSLSLTGLAFAGKLQNQLVKESTLEQILKRGVLRVGMDTFVPWAMKDKTGKFVGFEIDVAKQLAEDMGVKVEFVPTKWAGIIPALLTGKFDVIIGGMGIRTKRAMKVNFTIPYDYSGMSMVASKAKADGFSSLEDFNKSEVELAIKMGTTAVMAAKKFMPKAKRRLFEDQAQAYQELRNGNVHAVVGSSPRPAFEAAKYSETLFMPMRDNFTKEPIAFALRKGDFDTMVFFNGWIQTKRDQGWLQDKHHYWFGTRDWAHLVE
ncbi:MAG: transporter substrate-binding domain-containing protein [Desulfobacterales bacterium]|jgi:polar amino acid transport system substrate-binding protein|nr:transporter substrate-binding domain-containing protein [Desulfobacterales bacterium]MDP6683656.1 transporter substrate-binding domain-containing protein [Desulfobacterales bacterium]MDP6807861.1 transporter substrate-binding domain-containing protein [Desulfobacterales bacterium]|tara:strand:+ start:2464 stop:3294 length:831 start_codon:yes stop_codon:yes gene_type:complete